MLQQEGSMLPSSASVHEGNLRHSKTSKCMAGCLFHPCGVEMYTQIAVRFSHEIFAVNSREILPASIDVHDNKLQ